MKRSFLFTVPALLLLGCSSEPQPEAPPDTSKAESKFEATGSEGASSTSTKTDAAVSDQ